MDFIRIVGLLLVSAAWPAEFPGFIVRPLVDSAADPGNFRETLSPADLDRDGDLDFFTGQGRGGDQFWCENQGGGRFAFHLVSDSNDADVGAAVADVDGDGHPDRLAGGLLYLHPGDGRTQPFKTVRTGAPAFTHDLLSADFDRDGRPDFAIIDYPGIHWYRNPGAPFTDWPANEVSGSDTVQQHGGIALGDFDGDADVDIFRINRWFENRDGGRSWIQRPGPGFGISNPSPYGLSARTLVDDIDGDGDADLAQAECDVPNGRVAWFENAGQGTSWTLHLVKDSTDGQDFHSLAMADFDGDGDKDFFSCGSSLSQGPKKWFVWENLDGKHGAYREHLLLDSSEGGHEAVVFDVDGDGDPDIVGKQFNGRHVYLENRLRTGVFLALPLPRRGRFGWAGPFRGHPTPAFLTGGLSTVDAAGRSLPMRKPEVPVPGPSARR